MSDSELTYVRDLVFRDILRFFRASPQQHVSSLCSIEMTDSRFDLAYIELSFFTIEISVILNFQSTDKLLN